MLTEVAEMSAEDIIVPMTENDQHDVARAFLAMVYNKVSVWI